MPTLPNWNLSQPSRARMNELLTSVGDLGLDPDAVAAGGLAAFQALIALNRAKDAGEGAGRSQLLIRAQDAIRGLDPAVHGDLLQQIQSRIIALQGRSGDTEVAHVTPGEIVLPKSLQTSEVLAALRQAAEEAGMALDQFRVGDGRNSINPQTAQPEFADLTPKDMDEIKITAPRDEMFVRRPATQPDAGRYDYDDPNARFSRPMTVDLLDAVAAQWRATGAPPFGVGNMSMNDGRPYGGHDANGGHSTGISVDIRPIRKDGRPEPVTFNDPAYDREATQKLVDMFQATGGVARILFNDPDIKGVSKWVRHDDHLHVTVNPKRKKP